MPRKFRSFIWMIPPPIRPDAHRTLVTNTASHDATEAPGEAIKDASVTQTVTTKEPNGPLREVSLPPIATLDDPVADGDEDDHEDEDLEWEWESEEEVDELEGNE
ncbi:hypothetical protein RSAG8_09724, partial [Rhizoctonia solani AG-8 WAC10335]